MMLGHAVVHFLYRMYLINHTYVGAALPPLTNHTYIGATFIRMYGLM